jgi:hypothetical protein
MRRDVKRRVERKVKEGVEGETLRYVESEGGG